MRYGEGPAPIVRGQDYDGHSCADCGEMFESAEEARRHVRTTHRQANLGMATTDDLIRELQARMQEWDQKFWAVRGVLNGAFDALSSGGADRELAYRTVDQ